MQLEGKVVVITGAAGQLGQALTQTVLALGGRVVLLDREAPAAMGQAAADRLAGDRVDLTSLDAVSSAIAQAHARFGRIDALVNTAGGFDYKTLEDSTAQTWEFMFRINLMTAVTASKAVLPFLPGDGHGRIVNIGAAAAGKAAAGMGPYTASKAAVARFTEALAEELKPRRINVNAVLPTVIDTPRNRQDMPDADFSSWVPPSHIADVVAFLLSDASRAINGALLPVAGRP